MTGTLKSQLHQLIDTCNNDLLLQEIKSTRESSTTKDWWSALPEEDKLLAMESETEYKKGEFIAHTQLKEELQKWKNN